MSRMTGDMSTYSRRVGICAFAACLAIAFTTPIGVADHDATEHGCAVTPGGWGAPPRGNNPASLLYAHFDAVFGVVLIVGDLEFEEPADITEALPSRDALLNHVVALAINLALGEEGLLDGRLSGLEVPEGPYEGLTANELLALGEAALADTSRSPGEYSAIIEALTGFNEETYGCLPSPCPDGSMPGSDGECPPPCPDGQMRDGSGACVPICPDGTMPTDSGGCVPQCPDGEMPDEGGDCVPVCPDGEMPDESGDCVPADIPPCPADVTATAEQDGDIVLTWSAVAGADAYRVYRDGPEGGWMRVATVSTAAFTDSDTDVGATYSYRVTAVVDGVESTGCPVVTATAIPFFPTLAVGALAVVGALGAYAWLRRR